MKWLYFSFCVQFYILLYIMLPFGQLTFLESTNSPWPSVIRLEGWSKVMCRLSGQETLLKLDLDTEWGSSDGLSAPAGTSRSPGQQDQPVMPVILLSPEVTRVCLVSYQTGRCDSFLPGGPKSLCECSIQPSSNQLGLIFVTGRKMVQLWFGA